MVNTEEITSDMQQSSSLLMANTQSSRLTRDQTSRKPQKQRVCSHGRRQTRCKYCSGGSICIHKRLRYRCVHCSVDWAASTRIKSDPTGHTWGNAAATIQSILSLKSNVAKTASPSIDSTPFGTRNDVQADRYADTTSTIQSIVGQPGSNVSKTASPSTNSTLFGPGLVSVFFATGTEHHLWPTIPAVPATVMTGPVMMPPAAATATTAATLQLQALAAEPTGRTQLPDEMFAAFILKECHRLTSCISWWRDFAKAYDEPGQGNVALQHLIPCAQLCESLHHHLSRLHTSVTTPRSDQSDPRSEAVASCSEPPRGEQSAPWSEAVASCSEGPQGEQSAPQSEAGASCSEPPQGEQSAPRSEAGASCSEGPQGEQSAPRSEAGASCSEGTRVVQPLSVSRHSTQMPIWTNESRSPSHRSPSPMGETRTLQSTVVLPSCSPGCSAFQPFKMPPQVSTNSTSHSAELPGPDAECTDNIQE